MPATPDKSRKLRPERKRLYMFWKPQKRPAHMQPLPSSWRLIKLTAKTLWRYKWLFLGITLVYAILNLVLVRGFSGFGDVNTVRTSLDNAFEGKVSPLTSGLGILVYLAGASTTTQASSSAGAYQAVLLIVVSLAIIWALRQITAHHPVSFKQAYYQGMRPLVQYGLTLLVAVVQAIPLLFAVLLYTIVVSNGVVIYWYEHLVLYVIAAGLVVWSLRMLAATLMATYIVTLPGMVPVKAIRSAHRLVRFRRWAIIRKLIWLIVSLVLAAAVIMIPIILLIPVAAPWIFYLVTMFALTVFHAYLYGLYRELIDYAP